MVLPLIIGGGIAIGGLIGAAFADDDPELVPIPDVVEKIQAGNSKDWHEGVALANQMAGGQLELNQELITLLAELNHAWSGDGAEKIAARIQPLAEVTHQAALTFEANAANLDAAVHNFDQIKAGMEPMPIRPEQVQPGDDAFWQDHEKLINEYNAAAERNLDLYNGYTQHLQSSGPLLSIDHGQLAAFDNAPISISPGSAVDDQPAVTSSSPHPSASKNPGQPPVTSDGPTVDNLTSAKPAAAVAPDTQKATLSADTGTGTNNESTQHLGDHTTAAGHTPASGGTSGSTPGAPSFSSPVPGAPGGTGSLNGGISGLPRPGALPNPGPAGPPGAGKGVAGLPGSPRLSTPAPAAIGNPNSRGAGVPLAGMPASGTRDPRGEDVDHERKYGLPECVFDIDSDDDGPIDPKTGQRAVPPTIGA